MVTQEKLTTEEIEEFRKLVKEIKGVDLTVEEAEEQANRLVLLFDVVSGIDNVSPVGHNQD